MLRGVRIPELNFSDIGFLGMRPVFLEGLGVYKSRAVAHWMQTLPNQWRLGLENRRNDAQIVKIAISQAQTRLIENKCGQTSNGM